MAISKKSYPLRQDTIIIERREQVAVIKEDENGNDPMVVVAFRAMGQYLNDLASRAEEPDCEVEFTYMEVTFRAGFMPQVGHPLRSVPFDGQEDDG